MSLEPGRYNLSIRRGATFRRVITWKNPDGSAVDLTGYSVTLTIREHPNRPGSLMVLTLGTGIALEALDGRITLSLAPEVTAALPWTSAVYELEFEAPSGEITVLLEGQVTAKGVA